MTKAKALTAYLAGRQPAPFDWATANCVLFAAGFISQVEGRSIVLDAFRPASLRAARRLVREGGGLRAMVTAELRREPILPTLAQVGDLVLLPLSDTDPEAQALGLCCGEHAAAVTEDGGITMHPMANALAAWRVQP